MKIGTRHGEFTVKARTFTVDGPQILVWDGEKLCGAFPKDSVNYLTKHGDTIYTKEMEMEV